MTNTFKCVTTQGGWVHNWPSNGLFRTSLMPRPKQMPDWPPLSGKQHKAMLAYMSDWQIVSRLAAHTQHTLTAAGAIAMCMLAEQSIITMNQQQSCCSLHASFLHSLVILLCSGAFVCM
jgi:hypothetical protein